MIVVQLLGVIKIDLEDVADLSVCPPTPYLVERGIDKAPFKFTDRERLAHCPAVKVVCVIVHDVARLLLGVVVRKMAVVGLAVAPALHGYAALQTPFDKEVLVDVREKLQIDACVLEEGFPRKTGACVVMRRV